MNGSSADPGSSTASPRPAASESFGERPLIARPIKDSSRIDVDSLMNEFRRKLGPEKWEKYRDSLTHFLMGKLSRVELVKCLKDNLGLGGAAMRNHNTLVFSLLANACREAPPGTESSLAEWKSTTRSSKSRHSQMDSANDRIHKEILSLPVRERRRIKNIAKESMNAVKNQTIQPPPPVLVATRQAMLPHIPYLQDAHNSGNGGNNNNNNNNNTTNNNNSNSNKTGNGSAPGGGSPAPGSNNNKGGAAAGAGAGAGANANASTAAQVRAAQARNKEKEGTPNTGSAMLMDPLLGLHPGRSSGPLTWTQDIIQSLDVPLISESREIPDDHTLGTRMLGIALEHSVLGGIGPGTTDMMLVGLESYLRGIVDRLVSMKHRHISGNDPLTAADLKLLADMQPSEMGDISAPLYRLSTTYLEDEETVVPSPSSSKRSASDSELHTPLDIEKIRKIQKGDLSEEAKTALDEHEQGIKLLDQLLD